MNENIENRLTIHDMASHIGYSESHFYRLFYEQTHYAPMTYFMHLKINHACYLIFVVQRFSHFSFSYVFGLNSAVFLITLHGPKSHSGGDAEKSKYLMDDGLQATTTYEDRTDGICEVVHGVNVGG